jgi:hypothetical protein
MNSAQRLFLLSIIGIFILAIITNLSEKEDKGTIRELEYSRNNLRIYLEDKRELIIFSKKILNLSKGEQIYFKGAKEAGDSEIKVEKIWKIKK